MPTTAVTYPTTVAATTGSTWANTGNATGSGTGTVATFTNATSFGNGTITLSGYAFQTVIGAQPYSIDSVAVTVNSYESTPANWASGQVQLMTGATNIGVLSDVITLTSTTTNSQTFVFTGLANWADLSDLRVKITISHTNNTTSSVYNLDTVGVAVTYTSSAPAAGTIVPVGKLVATKATAGTTLTVAPVAVANILIVWGNVASSTIHFTTLSGGGVTTWNHVNGPNVIGTNSWDMWWGVVTSSGSSTITASASAALTGLTTTLAAQEFTANSTAATWALDGTVTLSNNSSSTTVTCPTKTPASGTELYIATGEPFSGTVQTGQTAGYTLVVPDIVSNVGAVLFNCTASGAQSPTFKLGSSTTSQMAGGLISATVPSSSIPVGLMYPPNQAVMRAATR